MRKTKIIATIGPVTESENQLRKLIQAGVNIFRLNFSHGDHEWHKNVIQRIRKINKELDSPVAILLDTQGPEIRTKGIDDVMKLKTGDLITFSYGSLCDDKEYKSIHVSYKKFVNDLNPKDIIVLDNGLINIEVVRKNKKMVYGKVLNSGEITNRKHINLPGVSVHLPSITDKDKKDILFGIKHKVDYIALSFVRCAKDIEHLKKILKKYKSNARIIAKIEDRQAVKNLNRIIQVSDAIMIARGDLGVEIPIEEVPVIQRRIINSCLYECKPVIVATHLLESMIENPLPTRAEATDVANAIWERSDAIMLSGETTAGKFPIKSVKMMHKIAKRIENDMTPDLLHSVKIFNINQEIARAACVLATNIKAKSILVFTKTGLSAKYISNFRPKVPVYAITDSAETERRNNLYFGVTSFKNTFYNDPERTINETIKILTKKKVLRKKDKVVIFSNILIQKERHDAIQVCKI